MQTVRLCKGCAGPLPVDAPEGLCPICLVNQGLDPASSIMRGSTPAQETVVAPRKTGNEPLAKIRYFGDYELLEEIARGGMGVVYQARQTSLNRLVAVKLILSGQLANDAEVKRFHTEAEAAANLQHPNIVAIHEIGEHAGQHYFSMDLVTGANLAQRLRQDPLPIGEAVRLTKTIAEAVHFAHQRGILHRDLKPANVLLDEFGQPRITDFGLAKRLEHGEHLTASGAVLGTPAYMSPEQAAGRQDIIGPAGDVFSLGVMLYEMITGRVPFDGSHLAETLSRILQDEPMPPSRLNPRVPPDLETICLKCLEKRPDRRYATADALAKDLERFLNHEAILARSVSAPQRAYRWLMRHPQLLAALASVVVLSLIWLAYGLWTENRFLAWEKEHPKEVMPAGIWSKYAANPTGLLILLTLGVTAGLEDLLTKRTRRRVLTGRFTPTRALVAFGLAGLGGVVLGILIGMAGIESWRWANHALPAAAESEAYLLRGLRQTLREESYLQIERGRKLNEHSEIHNPQKQGGPLKLSWVLFLAVISVWRGATLALKALREQRFVFFLSAEEEQTTLSRALLERRQEVQEKGRETSVINVAILLTVLLLLFPYLYWGPEEASWNSSFLLREAVAFALSLIWGLQSWRGSSRWHRLSRGLLVISALVAAVALLNRPAAIAGRGLVWGGLIGTSLGLFIRWTRRNKIETGQMRPPEQKP